MKKDSNNGQGKVLALLRNLPQPGKLLKDSVGDGVSGFSLRPKSIPKELARDNHSPMASIQLKLMKDGKGLGENQFKLNTSSNEWLQWIKEKPTFVLTAEDVGKGTDVIAERERNFNKNLLHEFLDRFSPTVVIGNEIAKGILHEDNYPIYFWDKPISVTGTYTSSNIQSIQTVIRGLGEEWTIEHGNLYFKYWDLLPDDKKPLMNAILKWHKALISLYHLLKRDGIEIPIDFAELEKTCWSEIHAILKS